MLLLTAAILMTSASEPKATWTYEVPSQMPVLAVENVAKRFPMPTTRGDETVYTTDELGQRETFSVVTIRPSRIYHDKQ